MDTNKTIEELIQEEKKQYFKEWRVNNKDKVKQQNANYWKRRVEKRLRENMKNEGEINNGNNQVNWRFRQGTQRRGPQNSYITILYQAKNQEW